MRIINAKDGNRAILRLRTNRAELYFDMVRRFGGPAYWESRNQPHELKEVMV